MRGGSFVRSTSRDTFRTPPRHHNQPRLNRSPRQRPVLTNTAASTPWSTARHQPQRGFARARPLFRSISARWRNWRGRPRRGGLQPPVSARCSAPTFRFTPIPIRIYHGGPRRSGGGPRRQRRVGVVGKRSRGAKVCFEVGGLQAAKTGGSSRPYDSIKASRAARVSIPSTAKVGQGPQRRRR